MINGMHDIGSRPGGEGPPTFFADVIGLASVSGAGLAHRRLPPAELAVHPADGEKPPQLNLLWRRHR